MRMTHEEEVKREWSEEWYGKELAKLRTAGHMRSVRELFASLGHLNGFSDTT
jgi:cytochrome b